MSVFYVLPGKMLDQITSELTVPQICALSRSSTEMHDRLQRTVDLGLCEYVDRGIIHVPPTYENYELISRIRQYWPDFDPTFQSQQTLPEDDTVYDPIDIEDDRDDEEEDKDMYDDMYNDDFRNEYDGLEYDGLEYGGFDLEDLEQ